MSKEMPRSDKLFFYALIPFAGIVIVVFMLLFKVLVENSIPIFIREGVEFILMNEWKPSEIDPNLEYYGILAPIIGTFYTSIIAVAFALPASIALTLFVNEYLPYKFKNSIVNIIEVMAGLPTILYGLWGAFVLAPLLKDYVMGPISSVLWFIPLFSCHPTSPSTIFTSGILLAIMVTPFITSIMREAYELIPFTYREAALSIGATRYEYSRIMFSMIRPAVIAALMLGFGRAAGETVAVSMTVGNSFSVSACMFKPGYTISSLIANQFGNAEFYKYMTNALYGAGLILLLVGLALDSVGLYLLVRWRGSLEGA